MTRRSWSMVALLAVGACSSAGLPAEPPPDGAIAPDALSPNPELYPAPEWATGTPADHGLDPLKLDEAATAAAANDSYCLLVIRHGVLVEERYFAGATASTTPKSWSIAKSYTATVAGIAIDNGDLPALDTTVASLLTEWAGSPRDTITIRDLLRMTSGLTWSVFQDYIRMATISRDQSGFAVDLAAADPSGSAWRYHNGGVQVIEPLFRAATGTTIEDYAREHLWSPIGMTATWAHDGAGHPTTYANVMTTCRDHARLGYLYLRGGRWAGRQIVSPEWVASTLTPSQPYNRGYGFLFWLNGEAPVLSPMNERREEQLFPYAPADMFSAKGFGSQFIDVIPSLDMVVVRFGKDPTATISLDVSQVTELLVADESSDTHRAILQPILDAVRD